MANKDNKSLDLCLPSAPEMVYEARQQFSEFMRGVAGLEEDVDDLKVALSEACTNAILHGSPEGRRDRFSVHCELSAEAVRIEVSDRGRKSWHRRPMPGTESMDPRGRGLFLMEQFCDGVQVKMTGSGTVVTMVKRIRKRPIGRGGPGGSDLAHQASAAPSRRGSDPPSRFAAAG